MNKSLLSLVCCTALVGAALPAHAQQGGAVRVDFLGPGGHSSSNYGRTSALHAAGRTVMLLQQSLPFGSYAITDLTGGNSVNSIASDGLISIRLNAADATAYQSLVSAVTAAAAAGAKAENDFRGVKAGDLTSGAPADIRYTVTASGFGFAQTTRALARPASALRTAKPAEHHDSDHVHN